MPIGAVSLRNNLEVSKPKTNKSQNFGRKHNEEQKNHKAAYIAASVGAVAALSVAAYIFRGKIANIPAFKSAVKMGSDVIDKAKKVSAEAYENATDFSKKAIENTREKASEMGTKIKETAVEISEKVKDGVRTGIVKGKSVFTRPAKFTSEEKAIFESIKNTKNAKAAPALEALKKYMSESEAKYIDGTLNLMHAKAIEKNARAKAPSIRAFMKEALEAKTPDEMVTALLNKAKEIRKGFEA